MAGEDLTSSRLAAPPLTPLTAEALTPTALVALGQRIDGGPGPTGCPTSSGERGSAFSA